VLTPALISALGELREYVHGFHPELELMSFPVEFWRNPDDDLYWEALLYFPLHMSGCICDAVPKGFRIAYPIFYLEDDYLINGWTALTNAGGDRLPSAIWAYGEIGLAAEARALAAALESIRQAPHDDRAAEAAYKSANSPNWSDEAREEYLFQYFCANRSLFEVAQ
jgi:hypothetical protein